MRHYLSIMTIIAILATTGCNSSSSSDGSAFVRAVHTSPDAPNVDVYLDGTLVIEDLTFGTASEFKRTTEGEHLVAIRISGDEPDTVPLLKVSVDLDENSYTDIVAANTPDQLEGFLVDSTTDEPAPTLAKVRFFHSSPNAPIVDITLDDGTTLFNDIAFGQSGGVIEVPAGKYNLEVRDETGTTTVLELGEVELLDGVCYSVYAIGLFDGDPSLTALITIDSEPLRANLRVGHLSPDAPDVDVCLDGLLILEAVPFEVVSDYMPVREGVHQFKVVATGAGCDDEGVIDIQVALAPNVDYSALATDIFDQITPLLLEDDNSPTTIGKGRLAFVHTSPNAPTVDITLTDGTTLFNDVSFGEAPIEIEVDAGTYDLQVRDETGAVVVLSIDDVIVEDGISYTAYATGLFEGDPELAALLVVNN